MSTLVDFSTPLVSTFVDVSTDRVNKTVTATAFSCSIVGRADRPRLVKHSRCIAVSRRGSSVSSEWGWNWLEERTAECVSTDVGLFTLRSTQVLRCRRGPHQRVHVSPVIQRLFIIIESPSCVSGARIAMMWWNYFDVCVRLHFYDFYCVCLFIYYCLFAISSEIISFIVTQQLTNIINTSCEAALLYKWKVYNILLLTGSAWMSVGAGTSVVCLTVFAAVDRQLRPSTRQASATSSWQSEAQWTHQRRWRRRAGRREMFCTDSHWRRAAVHCSRRSERRQLEEPTESSSARRRLRTHQELVVRSLTRCRRRTQSARRQASGWARRTEPEWQAWVSHTAAERTPQSCQAVSSSVCRQPSPSSVHAAAIRRTSKSPFLPRLSTVRRYSCGILEVGLGRLSWGSASQRLNMVEVDQWTWSTGSSRRSGDHDSHTSRTFPPPWSSYFRFPTATTGSRMSACGWSRRLCGDAAAPGPGCRRHCG